MSSWIEDVLLGTNAPMLTRDERGDILSISERVSYRVPATVATHTLQRWLNVFFSAEMIAIVVAIAYFPFPWAPLLVFPLLVAQLIIDRSIARYLARDWEPCTIAHQPGRSTAAGSSKFFWVATAIAGPLVVASLVLEKRALLVWGFVVFASAILWVRYRTRATDGKDIR